MDPMQISATKERSLPKPQFQPLRNYVFQHCWIDHIWIWNRFLKTGSAGRRPGQSRRRATTPNEDRYLVLTARRDRNMNATLLQQHLRSATSTTVSTQSVRNRLHGVGLYARRPMVCVRLTSRHRRDRRRGQQSM
ncbi:transposable element Tcb2 transposase [Trichonephila clavipes]|nr:transposable element Tcb2 transposase [Trichonephila clavipes]